MGWPIWWRLRCPTGSLGAWLLGAVLAAWGPTGALAQPLPGAASAPVGAEVPAADEAPVTVMHRTIAVLRAPLFGIPPRERAQRTSRTIRDLLERGGPGIVSVRTETVGNVLMIDGAYALALIPADADPLSQESLSVLTAKAEARLRQVVAEHHEANDRRRLLQAVAWTGVATVLFGAVGYAVWRLREALVRRTTRLLASGAERARVAGAPLLQFAGLRQASVWIVRLGSSLVLLTLLYQWLAFVMTQFPVSRAWGERLGELLVDALARVFGGALRAIPDLLVALVIVLVAKGVADAAGPFFDRIARGQVRLGWLDVDTVGPTRRLFRVGIWLFAAVMAYPYLPGADSDAFKGVSVLVGVMLTLGGSSLVGQGASGLILMYSRTLRVGEYVRISEQEGTVTDLGAFTTKIRTGLGEEISIPNAVVLATTTRNYSRTVSGPGYIVDTTVTIGYDTPWRQVHALLTEAANRTPGVLDQPPPQVFQTALSDFYVAYRLVAQAVPELPRPRAEVLHLLHANIQDVFNEAGVQIMSPHYLGDPATPKVAPVPRVAVPAGDPPS